MKEIGISCTDAGKEAIFFAPVITLGRQRAAILAMTAAREQPIYGMLRQLRISLGYSIPVRAYATDLYELKRHGLIKVHT